MRVGECGGKICYDGEKGEKSEYSRKVGATVHEQYCQARYYPLMSNII